MIVAKKLYALHQSQLVAHTPIISRNTSFGCIELLYGLDVSLAWHTWYHLFLQLSRCRGSSRLGGLILTLCQIHLRSLGGFCLDLSAAALVSLDKHGQGLVE